MTLLKAVQSDLQYYLNEIQQTVGDRYKLTLLCRYDGGDLDDADIILTSDDLTKARRALRNLATKEGEFS
jgi:hypothetical protein